VVATRVSGALEVIDDGVNGRLVNPGDAPDLARAILDLYRHPEVRARLGEAARDTVLAHYSQEAMLRRLESLYQELLEDRKSDGATGTASPN
ncbi:MAG TPA: glycosyltransferase, partial [Desulfobaccales bacterium]